MEGCVEVIVESVANAVIGFELGRTSYVHRFKF